MQGPPASYLLDVRGEEARADGARHRLSTATRPELIQQLGNVVLGRVLADDQRRADLTVGPTLRHQRQDLALTRAQPALPRGVRRSRSRAWLGQLLRVSHQ